MSNNSINNRSTSLNAGFVSAAHNIGRQLSLRTDPKYRLLWDVQSGRTLAAGSAQEIRLDEALLPYCPRMLPKGQLDEPRRIIDLADVEARTSIILVDEDGGDRIVSAIGSTRLDFGDSDLVFCRLEPYLGKILLNDPEQRWIGTTEWIPLRVNEKRVLPIYLKWLLLSPKFLETFGKLKAGKRHARTTERDLGNIRVPIPSINGQQAIASKLVALDRLLTEKHRRLRTRDEVIDNALAEELGYSISDFTTTGGPTSYFRQSPHIGTSLDLRTGVRFLRPEFDDIEARLKSLKCLRMRDVIDPVRSRLGATITPESYDEEGEALYISPDVIKGYEIDIASATTISSSFYDEHRRTSGLQRGDLIISRSGIGIGKVAIYEDERPAIFSDFTMRIRFTTRIAPFFGYCVGCSSLFQSQITKHKRGAAVPNFFPIQMKDFWFPCPPKPVQLSVAAKVLTALDTMKAQETELKTIREQIDALVLSVISATV